MADILERTIHPELADLPADAARYFLHLEFAAIDRERMNELAAKARAGTVKEAQEAELRAYMELGWFLDLQIESPPFARPAGILEHDGHAFIFA
jgi:hypothetical protein